MADKIKVLVVDDSALMRHVLSEILNSDPDIEVVGVAQDPYIARDKIKALNPDVLTLDVEMPKMDGLQFLRNLMRLRPMPVVMVSSLTTKGASVTLEALELGAVDFVAKPEIDVESKLREYKADIIEKVKVAAQANVENLVAHFNSNANKRVNKPKLEYKTTDQLIAIGASTGGTEAIREVLVDFPAESPGIVIVQHIPGSFAEPFAHRLDGHCQITVKIASEGERILRGHAYIAPGNVHLSVFKDGAQYRCKLSSETAENVSGHKPSVDVLFHSVAKHAGKNAVGALLTGMGKDGAEGLLAMREAGAYTIAQSEESSVVWGMPGAAVKMGAADKVFDLADVARAIIDASKKPSTAKSA